MGEVLGCRVVPRIAVAGYAEGRVVVCTIVTWQFGVDIVAGLAEVIVCGYRRACMVGFAGQQLCRPNRVTYTQFHELLAPVVAERIVTGRAVRRMA